MGRRRVLTSTEGENDPADTIRIQDQLDQRREVRGPSDRVHRQASRPAFDLRVRSRCAAFQHQAEVVESAGQATGRASRGREQARRAVT